MISGKIHDKVFTCPKCTNKTLYVIDAHKILGVAHDDLGICDECAAKLRARVSYEGDVEFVDIEEEY